MNCAVQICPAHAAGLRGSVGERSAPNLQGMGAKDVGDLADLLPPAPRHIVHKKAPSNAQLPPLAPAQGVLQPPLAAGLPQPAMPPVRSKPMSVAERQLEAMGLKKGGQGEGGAQHRRSQSSASGGRRGRAALPAGAASASDLE